MRIQVPLFLGTILLAGCFQSEAPRPPDSEGPPPQAVTRPAAVSPLPDDPEPSLTELAATAEHGASPAIRADAVYAMADVGTRSDPGAVGAALNDADAEVRRAAVVALTGLEGEVAASYLATALNDRDVRVRRDAAEALGEVGGPTARLALRQALLDPDPVVREIAAELLAEPATGR